MNGEIWVNGDQFLERVHPREACMGAHCCLHNPSEHHMRNWPMKMRHSGLMERFCAHGIGHPDPDSLAYFEQELGVDGFGVHGCDGCCHKDAKGMVPGCPRCFMENKACASHCDPATCPDPAHGEDHAP